MHRLLRNNIWFRFWSNVVRPIERTANWLNWATNGLLFRIVRAIYRFTTYGPHEAAALAYYALFSLFPLMLLAIVLSASILGSAAASNQMRDILDFFFPGDTATILQDAVTAAVEQRNSISIFAIIVLGWSSANLFGNLEKVLANVFHVEVRRRIYERRLVGIIMICVLIVFLVASLITNVIFSLLNLVFLNQFNTWLRMASFFVPTAFNAAIFAMLYGYVTPLRLRWDAILPSAILGGLAFEYAKRGFGWYLGSATSLSLIYGSVTTVVVFMLWAFIIFCIILICAEICAELNDWMDKRVAYPDEYEDSPSLTSGDDPYLLLPSPD